MHVVLQHRRHLRNWVADLITTSWCLAGSFWDSSILHLDELTPSRLSPPSPSLLLTAPDVLMPKDS